MSGDEPTFKQGGVVPGPIGKPIKVWVFAGEEIIPVVKK